MFRHTLLPYLLQPAPRMKLQNLNYDLYWDLRAPMDVHPRFKIISNLIENGSSVLDVGCGRGELLEYLERENQIQGYGLDISSTAIKEAQKKNITAEVADAMVWRSEKVFDYVVLTEILEHISSPEQVLLNLKANFRKGLLISIPNTGYYKDRLRLLFGHFPVQWNFHPSEHLRYWTVSDFELWLKELGLCSVYLCASIGTRFLRQVYPALFGAQVVFLVKKSNQ